MNQKQQPKLNTFILFGSIEAGKSSLFKELFKNEYDQEGHESQVLKTQATEFHKNAVDTPGEFFSHPRLYNALITTLSDIDILVYVHSSLDFEFIMPPGLLDIYKDKQIISVITKTDAKGAKPDLVESILKNNGLNGSIFKTSICDPKSIELLRSYLFKCSNVDFEH